MRRPALLLTLLSLALGCAHAGLDDPRGWITVKTKHFNLRTGEHHDFWKRPLAELESAHAALSSSFFKAAPAAPVDVLFLEHEDFQEKFSRNPAPVAVATAPADVQFGRDGLLIISHDIRGMTEGLVHLLMDRSFKAPPYWLEQGLPRYLRALTYLKQESGVMACFGRGVPTQLTLVKKEHKIVNTTVVSWAPEFEEPDHVPIPLSELFTLSFKPGPDDRRPHYARSGRALIDYLFHGDGSAYRSKAAPTLARIAAGDDSVSAFAATFPRVSLDELTRRVEAHDRKLAEALKQGPTPRGPCPLAFPILAEHAADFDPVVVGPVAPEAMKPLLEWVPTLPRKMWGFPRHYSRAALAQKP